MALIVMCDGCGKWAQFDRDIRRREYGQSRWPEEFRPYYTDHRRSDSDPLVSSGVELHVCSDSCAARIGERLPVVQIKRVDTSIT